MFCRFKSRKFQNTISFLVVSLCVAVLIIALSLSNGFEKTLIDKLIVASPHVTVIGDYNNLKIPQKDLISNDINIAQVQSLSINPDNNQVQGVLLRGTYSDKIPELFGKKDILEIGKFPVSGEAIIGNKLAETCNLSVGDTVKILTGPAVSTEFKVSGIFKVGLYDFDSNVIIAPYKDIEYLTPEQGEGIAADVNIFRALWLKKPMESKLFAEKISALNPGIITSNWQDDNKSLIDAIAVEKKVIFIVLLLLVVAASVAIANSQFIQIVSQQEQIAILSSIGFTSRHVLFTFVLEGLLIALIGSVLGLLMALGVVTYIANFPLNLPMDVYQVESIPVELKYSDVVITSLCAIVMVCLSSMVPAYYASRLDPVEVLRRA